MPAYIRSKTLTKISCLPDILPFALKDSYSASDVILFYFLILFYPFAWSTKAQTNCQTRCLVFHRRKNNNKTENNNNNTCMI